MLFVRSFALHKQHELPGTFESIPEKASFAGWKRTAVMMVLLLSVACPAIFIGSSSFFYRLGKENGPVELLSAIFCFCASASYTATYLTLRRSSLKVRQKHLLPAVLAFLLFCTGMEEISWGQQFFFFQTPDIFAGNTQGETNLHNYATNLSENIYYCSSFLYLVLLPFLLRSNRISGAGRSGLLPGDLSIMTASVIYAYNYDMWNGILTQLTFFMTASILVSSAPDISQKRKKQLISIPGALLATCLATQLIWLFFGDRFVRIWDVTEFKELFIPLALTIASAEMLEKTREMTSKQQFPVSIPEPANPCKGNC